MPKVKQPQKFTIETLPWKSKRIPKEIPEPLPTENICWSLVSRRGGGKTLLMVNLIRAYKKHMDTIVILSPTVHLDPKWQSVAKYDNVYVSDTVNNEMLENIVENQKRVYDRNTPKENRCLLVIDDSGNFFRRKELRLMMNVLYTTFRHYGGNLICGVQSLLHMDSIQISNSTQWCIWDMNQKQLKKLATDLATSRINEDQLERFVRQNTVKPFSFVFIDYTKSQDQSFWVGFDSIWNPSGAT